MAIAGLFALRCLGSHAYYIVCYNKLIVYNNTRIEKVLVIINNIYKTGIDYCNLVINEEFVVSTSHYLVLTSSLSFVHTARRSYQPI